MNRLPYTRICPTFEKVSVMMASALERLTRVNVDDLLTAFGLQQNRVGRQLFTWLLTPPARRFARQVLEYDRRVGLAEFAGASQWGLQTFQTTVKIYQATPLPTTGPLLLLSNHPGLTDALVIFANVPRPDLRVIAATRSFLQVLPNIDQRLIYADLTGGSGPNRQTIRCAATHLQNGGALLTFPAGKIEPDPAIYAAEAGAAFAHWSPSIDLFARLAPATQIVPVLVSGVINPRAHRHPLTRLRRTRKDRDWLGATLQLLIPAYQAVQAEIRFGEPILASAMSRRDQPRAVTAAVVAAMQQLVKQRDTVETA